MIGELSRRPDYQFWRGKRVLLTGHTGFKGAWLSLWLSRMGAEVTGVAMEPVTSPNLFSLARVQSGLKAHHLLDINDLSALSSVLHDAQPEVVLHLAAQPLVRRSYLEPAMTFASNVMGTVNLLEAVRREECVRVAVVVTTDKVYADREWRWPYRESDTLGGHDPYSASKAASEMVIHSYRESFLRARGVKVASARAGNVIGGGDWSEDRLLPDAVRAWQAGRELEIRMPDAVRPWQHVLEPLYAYLILAQSLWLGSASGEAYNFGPAVQDAETVRRVVELAQASWHGFGAGSITRQTQTEGAPVIFGEATMGYKESSHLSLDTSRARSVLGLAPRWGLEESVSRSIDWYRAVLAGGDAFVLCQTDIEAFEAAS